MRAITAVDSVSLAIQRTREFLFRQFTWGTYLKLGLVAIVTEGLGSNVNSGSHRGMHGGSGGGIHPPTGLSPFHMTPHWPSPEVVAVIAAAVMAAFLFAFLVAYLVTRLRFAYFHCLIHNSKLIRPGWALYSQQAMRFFLLNVVVGFCFLGVLILIAIPFVNGFVQLFQQISQGGKPDFGLLLSLILPLIPILLLLALLGIATNMILRDWILPHMALEDATAGEAWSSVWARITAEKREFFVYALLRVALPIVAAVGLTIVLMIPGLVLAGALAAVEFGIHSMFSDATGASALVGILLQAFFGVLAFGFALLAAICLGGPLSTGLREYALIFYGGRYQVLGDILYPTLAQPGPAGGSSQIV
jgi:hypothetical protein